MNRNSHPWTEPGGQGPAHELARLPITVILNAGAGHGDKEEIRARIDEALRASGREYRIVDVREPADVPRLARRAAEEGRVRPQIVAAAGGDGTLNAVADALLGTGLPFGVIPLGTFNFFARDLGIPLDPGRAAQALTTGGLRRVPVGRVNGNLFLINACFGLYRAVLEEREEFKRRFGRYRFLAVPSALATLWRNHRRYRVHLELDGRPVEISTLMIFFGLNALQLEKLGLGVADCAAHGLLALLVLRPMRRLELLGFALRGALQGLDQPQNMRCFCASTVEVHSRGDAHIAVAVDGESIRCDLPLRIEALPAALPVVVPREPEVRE